MRAANGKTLNELAQVRHVTKAAIHQLENRPLAKVSIGSLLGYLQALGYPVDEEWIAQTDSAAPTDAMRIVAHDGDAVETGARLRRPGS